MTEQVVVAGKNQIAIDVLEAVLARVDPDHVVAVPNRTDDGRTGWQPSFARYAASRGVRVATLDAVLAAPDQLFLSIEFDRIVVPSRFASSRLYNIHFSLLPKYRGVYTAIWPVWNGDDRAGVTLHVIDTGIDTGDVIAQRGFAVDATMTSRDVYLHCLQTGSQLVRDHLDALVAGPPPTTRQPIQGATYHDRASIDWATLELPTSVTAWQLVNFVRAFTFPEYQVTRVDGLAIGRATALPQRSARKPGVITDRGDGWVDVATIDHDVRLTFAAQECLIDAARQGDLDGLRRWRALGADVDRRGGHGWTALHAAIYAGQTAATELLLGEFGADPNIGNFRGTRPLMCARSAPDRAAAALIVQRLLAAGADLHAPDEDGRDVIHYAEAEGTADFLGRVRARL